MYQQITLLVLIITLVGSCQEQTQQAAPETPANSVKNLNGQDVSIDSISVFLDKKMEEMKIPGLSFVIINDGRVVYHALKGFADVEQGIPVTEATLFEGASTSKALFAYTIMHLVEEGKIALDTPLYTYLSPALQGIYNHDQRYEQITARYALAHMTGFPNWRGNSDLTISFEPGTSFGYSGEGYQFLVRAAEAVLDSNYLGLEHYFREEVAAAAGMTHTRYVQNEYNRGHKAHPYKEGEEMELNSWTAAEFNAASAVHTEALEFSNWIISMMNGKGLSEGTYEEMLEAQITTERAPAMMEEEGAIAWTLGFAKYDLDGQIVYGHEGNNDGFNALFLMDLDKKWAMVQFNNAHEVYDFGFDVFRFLNGK